MAMLAFCKIRSYTWSWPGAGNRTMLLFLSSSIVRLGSLAHRSLLLLANDALLYLLELSTTPQGMEGMGKWS